MTHLAAFMQLGSIGKGSLVVVWALPCNLAVAKD